MDPRPHGLNEVSLDSYTRSMHKNISRSLQENFRDRGHFKAVSDHLVTLAAAVMVPYYGRFIQLGQQQRTFQYGKTSQHSIHVINLRTSKEAKTDVGSEDRVVLFVHGGAWGSGKPWMYRLSAAGLAKCIDAKVVILIEYKVYPHNHILEQRDDILNAINFIRSSSQWKPDWLKRGGRNIRLVLSGHSSGANISALALFKAIEDGYLLVDQFIGLSGVFHLYKHYLWEKARGVHLISPMRGAAELAGGFDLCSPTKVLQIEYENADVVVSAGIHDDIDDRDDRTETTSGGGRISYARRQLNLLPEIFLLHGIDDRTVPCSSSSEFADELALKGVPVHKAFIPHMDHATPIVELCAKNCETSPTGIALRRWHEKNAAKSPTKNPRARL